MAAEISNQLTASAEVNLTAASLAGGAHAQSVHASNDSSGDSCGANDANDDSIVSVDVPNGGGDGDFDRFDDLELGAEDGAVPLGDILDKFEAVAAAPCGGGVGDAVADGADTAISATVNVSTLDLSDPESIHRHLSQLNDTVLKVSTACVRLSDVDNGGGGENNIGDLQFHASTLSSSSPCSSVDPQTQILPHPPPQTLTPTSASSPKPPPLPPLTPLEILPSGTRSIRTFDYL